MFIDVEVFLGQKKIIRFQKNTYLLESCQIGSKVKYSSL